MVNTGKPSTGCATCKKRKIKCDERRPYCLRCEKIGKDCPGVPAPLDFVFRPGKAVSSGNGIDSPIRSLSKSKSRAGRDRAPSYDSKKSPVEFGSTATLTRQPSLSLENQGVAVFFKDFVMAPQNTVLGNFLSCLPSVYGSASSTSPLRYAVAANAISTLRSYLMKPCLWNAALWYYGQALEAMRESMGDDRKVQGDDVLMTVMLLKLFENQVGSAKNLVGYEYHTTAAAALLVKRGSSQFSNSSSLRLFRTIRWHVFMVSIQSSRYPSTLYSGFDWFADREIPDENSDSSRLAAAAFELPLLRCQAMSVLSQPDHLRVKSEVHDLLARAARIDEELVAWHSSLGEQWEPAVQLVNTDPLADAWQGVVHVFGSTLTALHLNTYRLLRILANGIALRCAAALSAAGDVSAEPHTKGAGFVLQNMVDDVCASVPWHLNYWPDNTAKNSALEAGAGLGVAGAYFLIWPLFVAMNVHCVPLAQRQWCCRKLRDVGTEFGFRQAVPLADTFLY